MGKGRDGAEGTVLGELIVIAIGVAAAAALFFLFVGLGADAPEPPAALGLNEVDASDDDARTLRVARADTAVRWSDLSFFLGQAELAYDEALAGEGTYCIVRDAACQPALPADEIQAGDELRVHATAIRGRTLSVRDDTANALLISRTL